MKKTYAYLFAALALVLVGSGCFSADDHYEDDMEDTMVEETMDDSAMEEEEVMEERLVELKNNFIPGFYLTYDDNKYTVARGEEGEPVESTADFLLVNAADVWLFAEDGSPEDRLLSMTFTNGEGVDYATVEELMGAYSESEDMQFGGIDARRYDMEDGETKYVILATTGYYVLTVHDQEVAPIVDTLQF